MKILLLIIFISYKSQGEDILTVGLLNSYPWAYKDYHGETTGVYPDLFKHIEKISSGNIVFSVTLLPLKRALKSTESGHTMLTVMSYKPEREKSLNRLTLIYRTPFTVLSLKSKPIRSLSSLDNKKMAVLTGGSQCPCLPNVAIERFNVDSHYQALKYLSKNRVDAVSGPALRLMTQAKALNMQMDLSAPLIYEWRDVWLWSSPLLNQELHSSIERYWSVMSKSGFTKQLIHSYFDASLVPYIQLK